MNLVSTSIVVFVFGVIVGRVWGRWRWVPRPLMKASGTDRMLLERVQEENFHLDVFGKLRAPSQRSLVMNKILKALKSEKDLDQGKNPFMSRVDSKNPELTMSEALREIELIAEDSLKVGYESETIKILRANARRLRGA